MIQFFSKLWKTGCELGKTGWEIVWEFFWQTCDWVVPMVHFQYRAISRHIWYFLHFNLLFGTLVQYSRTLGIYCIYYVIKVETVGWGGKCSNQQKTSQWCAWHCFGVSHFTLVFVFLLWLVLYDGKSCFIFFYIYNILFIWYKCCNCQCAKIHWGELNYFDNACCTQSTQYYCCCSFLQKLNIEQNSRLQVLVKIL